MEELKRRIRLDLMKPAEIAIYVAMGEVEKIGADVKLTEAVTLLAKAKDLVSDFIDGINRDIDNNIHYYKCPECGRIQATTSQSPEWLLNEVNIIKIHWHKTYKTICRTPYVEISKDEFFELSINQYTDTEQIKPSI